MTASSRYSVSGQAVFEAREPGTAGLALADIKQRGTGKSASFEAREPATVYKGVERRRNHRRTTADRRVDMRFEPDKQDRRANPGRRAEDKSPKFW